MATDSVCPGARKPLVGKGIERLALSHSQQPLSVSIVSIELMPLTQMLPVLSALFALLSFFLPLAAYVTKARSA